MVGMESTTAPKILPPFVPQTPSGGVFSVLYLHRPNKSRIFAVGMIAKKFATKNFAVRETPSNAYEKSPQMRMKKPFKCSTENPFKCV